MRLRAVGAVLFFSCICLWAQNNQPNSAVPKLVPFSGIVSDASGKPPARAVHLPAAVGTTDGFKRGNK